MNLALWYNFVIYKITTILHYIFADNGRRHGNDYNKL